MNTAKSNDDYSITMTANRDTANSEFVYSQDNRTGENSNAAVISSNMQPDAKLTAPKDIHYVPRTTRRLRHTHNGLL